MRYIYWHEELDDRDLMEQCIQRAVKMGFTEVYAPYAVGHSNGQRLSNLCLDNGLPLIVSIPNPVSIKLTGFRDWQGRDSMDMAAKSPLGKKSRTAIPNFADPGTLDAIRAQADSWSKRADSVYLMCGIDGFYYPDVSPISGDFTRSEVYWAFDDCMLATFHAFLAVKFKEVDRYNAIFGTTYQTFEEIRPAKTPKDDHHALTYAWYSSVMVAFLNHALTELLRRFQTAEIYIPLDIHRDWHGLALGRVGLEAAYEKVLLLFQPASRVWQWANSVYGPTQTAPEAAIDIARYSRRWLGKVVVGVEGPVGLVKYKNGIRAIRDGHKAVACYPYYRSAGDVTQSDEEIRDAIEEMKQLCKAIDEP